MARSQYIYLVMRQGASGIDSILGAFTVKHEMERFVSKFDEPLVAFRVRDGQFAEPRPI